MVSAWFPFKSPQNASIETKHFGQHQASTIAMAAATSTERSSSTQERWLKFISIGMGILHLKNVELELSNFHFVTLKCTMSTMSIQFPIEVEISDASFTEKNLGRTWPFLRGLLGAKWMSTVMAMASCYTWLFQWDYTFYKWGNWMRHDSPLNLLKTSKNSECGMFWNAPTWTCHHCSPPAARLRT